MSRSIPQRSSVAFRNPSRPRVIEYSARWSSQMVRTTQRGGIRGARFDEADSRLVISVPISTSFLSRTRGLRRRAPATYTVDIQRRHVKKEVQGCQTYPVGLQWRGEGLEMVTQAD